MGRFFGSAILTVTACIGAVSAVVCAEPAAGVRPGSSTAGQRPSVATDFPEPEPALTDWLSAGPPSPVAATPPAESAPPRMLFFGPDRSAPTTASESEATVRASDAARPASSEQLYLEARRRQQRTQRRQATPPPPPQTQPPPAFPQSTNQYLEARRRQSQVRRPGPPVVAPPSTTTNISVSETNPAESVELFDEARRLQSQSQLPQRATRPAPSPEGIVVAPLSGPAPEVQAPLERHESTLPARIERQPPQPSPVPRIAVAPAPQASLPPVPQLDAPDDSLQAVTGFELFDKARLRQRPTQPSLPVPAAMPPLVAAAPSADPAEALERYDDARRMQSRSQQGPAVPRLPEPEGVAAVPSGERATAPQSRAALYSDARRRQLLSHDRMSLPEWGTAPDDVAPPAPPLERQAIDVTAFAGDRDGMGGIAPLGAMSDESDSRPSLQLESPFVDDLPPVVQVGYEESGDSQQIARPMFNQLLDESEQSPILQTGLEFPAWDAVRGWAAPDHHNHECEECWDNPWERLFCLGIHKNTPDIGIGQERVALGGFEIDASQPFNNVRVRYDSVYGLPFPDRALWFWAKSGNGPPAAGEVVNYQDFRVYSEIGGKSASAIVEYPLRSLDPEINGNTTGFGDMVVGNKAVIVDGRYWQITQVFRTYVNSGNVKKGLGNGHVSLEPGVLARYKWTDSTYLHGELKFWFPVGADPNFGGQILRTGFGISTIGYETDTFAAIHSSEIVFYNFVGGRKTVFPVGSRSVDGEVCATWLFGERFVLGPAGDLGLFEVGVNGGFGMGDSWIDGMVRFELRWSY
ncbi:MAG: hypothetical protein JNG89_17665 [Planctomycetaceae bacterium]|nr:hypothetical protein [Planctomycetaceae bacterium]